VLLHAARYYGNVVAAPQPGDHRAATLLASLGIQVSMAVAPPVSYLG
jgi:hypothetical protein